MPAFAMVWDEDSKHAFGVSAFGISGFRVTFPECMTNPINMSQSLGGFGCIESDYILLQIGFTWAYEFSDKLPIRLGYTYSSNPINNDVTFFNIPATAIIKNAYMFGFSYEVNNRFSLDAVYHHAASDGETLGQILNPMFIGSYPPYGAIPDSEVSYKMTTDMIMVGFSYTFRAKSTENNEI